MFKAVPHLVILMPMKHCSCILCFALKINKLFVFWCYIVIFTIGGTLQALCVHYLLRSNTPNNLLPSHAFFQAKNIPKSFLSGEDPWSPLGELNYDAPETL